ncbi:MAG: hypothetical protein KIT09_09460 [Bryobacteraceae bacterium]|nr:hypothetical protein [Bryobacteraceae bacterium]
MIQFLSTTLWKTVATESKNAKTKRAAIAYVTRNVPLSLGAGDILIVDASDAAIGSGQTSAKVLGKLFRKGVKLFSYPGLHAKTVVLDSIAFVSSANLSDSSLNHLLEAGIRTDHPTVVSKAIRFIDDLAEHSAQINRPFVDRISKISVKKHWNDSGTRRKRAFPADEREPKTWLLGVHAIDDPKDPAELTRIEKGEVAASELLKNPKSNTSWIRYGKTYRVAKEARKEDSVIIIWRGTPRGEPELVYHHAPVLLNQSEPSCNRIFYEEFPNAARKALPWRRFRALLKQVGLPADISKNASRELDPHFSDALHDLWGHARGN